VKSHIWSITFYGAETWTLQKIDHNFLASSVMWFCRRVKEISVTDRVRNKELGGTVERNVILKKIKTKKAVWIVTSCVGTVF